jgi:hypothetical protein
MSGATDPERTDDALRSAMEQLGAMATAPSRGLEVAWLERVRSAANDLFELLGEHRHVTEDEGGLEHEHADMLHRAAEIDVEVERQLAAQDYNVPLVRLEATVLRDILLLHLVRSNTLLSEAYLQVEGGEGG